MVYSTVDIIQILTEVKLNWYNIWKSNTFLMVQKGSGKAYFPLDLKDYFVIFNVRYNGDSQRESVIFLFNDGSHWK